MKLPELLMTTLALCACSPPAPAPPPSRPPSSSVKHQVVPAVLDARPALASPRRLVLVAPEQEIPLASRAIGDMAVLRGVAFAAVSGAEGGFYLLPIDAEGRAGRATPLPFEPELLAACADRLFLTGRRMDSGREVVATANNTGAVERILDLPVTGKVTRAPRPLCLPGGRVRLFWEQGGGGATLDVLSWADLTDNGIGPPHTHAWQESTDRLGMTVVRGEPLLLRLHNLRQVAEVHRFADGQLTARVTLPVLATGDPVPVGDRILALVDNKPRELDLVTLDGELRLAGAPVPIARVKGPRSLFPSLLVSGRDDAIAVAFMIATLHLPVHTTTDIDPATSYQHALVLYDLHTSTVSAQAPIHSPFSGAWLGDRLILLTQTTGVAASVYELARE